MLIELRVGGLERIVVDSITEDCIRGRGKNVVVSPLEESSFLPFPRGQAEESLFELLLHSLAHRVKRVAPHEGVQLMVDVRR